MSGDKPMEVATPNFDRLDYNSHTVRATQFEFGPFYFHFILQDYERFSEKTKKAIYKQEKDEDWNEKLFPKRYRIIFNIEDRTVWYMETFENRDLAIEEYNKLIAKMKHGESIEMIDQLGAQKNVVLSYAGITWLN